MFRGSATVKQLHTYKIQRNKKKLKSKKTKMCALFASRHQTILHLYEE